MHLHPPPSLSAYITLLLSILLTACNPLFVTRAAYEESKILLAREPIHEIISQPDTTPLIKQKLALVLDARAYTESMGLSPGDSFTQYTHLDRDVLTWVLVASRPDAFDLHTWWYPIVGSMPYKGFFSKKVAQCAATRLEADGYETTVRGAAAFSTLGWFNDPVLTPTLKQPLVSIAATVIHETVHRTVWFPGEVSFNESLAQFVGLQGAVDFFADRAARCAETQHTTRTTSVCTTHHTLAKQAENALTFELELAAVISDLYDRLSTLYRSPKPRAQKLKERVTIFHRVVDPFRARFPNLRVLKNINNSEIMQLKIYHTELSLFNQLYLRCNRDWQCFISRVKKLSHAKGSLFQGLRDQVG